MKAIVYAKYRPPDVLQLKVLDDLAGLYRGKYAEAEPLYQRSLLIREKALGPDQPRTPTSDRTENPSRNAAINPVRPAGCQK